MNILLPYTLSLGDATDEYVDIAVATSSAATYSFSLQFRRSGMTEWRRDAVIYCATAKGVSGNVVAGVTGDCAVRWHYALSGLRRFDDMEVRIIPEVSLGIHSPASGVNMVTETDATGIVSARSTWAGTTSGSAGVVGTGVTWMGNPIFSGVGISSYVEQILFNGTTTILVADPDGQRVLEINTAGATVNSLDVSPAVPSFCAYDYDTGNVAYCDSSAGNVVVVRWKLPPETATSPTFGFPEFDYIADMSYPPISGLVSATFGTTANTLAISKGDGVLVVNIQTWTQDSYLAADFETPRETATVASLTLSGIAFAYEHGEGNVTAVRRGGDVLGFSAVKASHETYQRSLGEMSAVEIHSGLRNDIFWPVPPRKTLTLDVLNKDELRKADLQLFKLSPASTFLSFAPPDRHRGDIAWKGTQWGVAEALVVGSGTQTLVALTGQRVSVEVPATLSRIGYARNGTDLTPAFVEEALTVSLLDCDTGLSQTLVDGEPVSSGIAFDAVMPEATSDSYARSLASGRHGTFLLRVDVTERYYDQEDGSAEVFPSRTFRFDIGIVTMWWRQIMKEAQTSRSPVADFGFQLDDYAETIQAFYSNWTRFPSFYPVVGGIAVVPTDEQKDAAIRESCFALLTFMAGVCPGDSPVGSSFCTDPAAYSGSGAQPPNNLSRPPAALAQQPQQPFPGLSADCQFGNSIAEDLGVPSGGQSVRESVQLLFLGWNAASGANFRTDMQQNGMLVVPSAVSPSSAFVSVLDGIVSLDISLDEPTFTLSAFEVLGGSDFDRVPAVGDQDVAVKFVLGTGPTLAAVEYGLSVNRGPFFYFKDITGLTRQYNFGLASPLAGDSLLRGRLRLQDPDGGWHLFECRYSLAPSANRSAVRNVRIEDDRPGKTLIVRYDLDAAYSFIPVTVNMSLTLNGADFPNAFFGDIGPVFGGTDRAALLSYEIAEESALEQIAALAISGADPVFGSVSGDLSFSFFIRPPQIPVPLADGRIVETRRTQAPSSPLKFDSQNFKQAQTTSLLAPARYRISSSSSRSSSKSMSSSNSSSSSSSS